MSHWRYCSARPPRWRLIQASSDRGSLPLDELTAVIAKSARLQQEINVVLSEGNKKQEDVTCFGMRFPGQWKHLGGLRVSPYTCDFGAMWLQIRDDHRQGDEQCNERQRNKSDLEMDDRMLASVHPRQVLVKPQARPDRMHPGKRPAAWSKDGEQFRGNPSQANAGPKNQGRSGASTAGLNLS